MKIKVVRRWFGDETTISKVLINERFFCYGLEDQIRPVGSKVYGETAIPYGTYEVTLRWWAKHSITVPQINNVPGFAGILIHPGTTNADTLGCLIVGYKKGIYKGKPAVFESKKASADLTSKVREAIEKGEKVTIQFVNYEERAVKIIASIVGFFLSFGWVENI